MIVESAEVIRNFGKTLRAKNEEKICLACFKSIFEADFQYSNNVENLEKSILSKQNVFGVTFENIQANTSKFVNIWVINLCDESHFWSRHWIIFWQE